MDITIKDNEKYIHKIDITNTALHTRDKDSLKNVGFLLVMVVWITITDNEKDIHKKDTTNMSFHARD